MPQPPSSMANFKDDTVGGTNDAHMHTNIKYVVNVSKQKPYIEQSL